MKNWLVGIALTFLVCLSGWGCAPEADPAPEWVDLGPVPVSYTVSPEPDLFGWALRAAGRWNRARGCTEGSLCEILIAEDGIPVEYVPEIIQRTHDGRPLLDADGNMLYALATIDPDSWPMYPGMEWKSISVLDKLADPETTLVHEFMHMFTASAGHTETGAGFDTAKPRSFEEMVAAEAWTISAEMLDAVCAVTLCLDQIPEVAQP